MTGMMTGDMGMTPETEMIETGKGPGALILSVEEIQGPPDQIVEVAMTEIVAETLREIEIILRQIRKER